MTASAHRQSKLFALAVGSVGVVYGDIGTSPLYAFRESLSAAAGDGGLRPEMVLGVLSLILWSLFITVTLKYVVLLLRADNRGEGGILSLMALALESLPKSAKRSTQWIMTLGMIGAALFYGDAIITPAISVLSAVEGLKLVTHRFEHYIIPIAMTVMLLLFLMQSRGTHKVARFFGPLMVVWFLAMAWGGLLHIGDSPVVWYALHPGHALYFLTHHGMASLIALGAVFLAVTGAEALYADLGHFGKKPIRLAWLLFVMPCLVLNYFGQAALVLAHPEAMEDTFFLLYPAPLLLPMVLLATLATVVASQAVITGAYSLTQQASQLGLLPRLSIQYTSKDNAGQIYMPQVNWVLLAGVIMLIEIFRTSDSLASAYGIAVTGTMVITAILAFVVIRRRWQWPLLAAAIVIVPLLLIDLAFFGANLTKFLEGGFVPVAMSAVMVLMMRTWVRGSHALHEQTRDYQNTMDSLIGDLRRHPPKRASGAAIYLTSNVAYAPSALLQNLKHNKVLHDENILMTLRFDTKPYVADADRVEIEQLCDEFTRVTMHFGFMESPNVVRGLSLLRARGLKLDMMNTSFFISRRNIVPSAKFGMPLWRDQIFIMMANNATDAADYFHIPTSRVVELGVQMTV